MEGFPVRTVESDAELKAVGHLRFEVYVGELKRDNYSYVNPVEQVPHPPPPPGPAHMLPLSLSAPAPPPGRHNSTWGPGCARGAGEPAQSPTP